MINDEALIRSLRELGEDIPVTKRNDGAGERFVTQVRRRVDGLPPPRVLRRRRLQRRIGAGAVAVVLAFLPGPRAAVARWLGIGSVRIQNDPGRRIEGVPPEVLDLELGARSTLADASALLGHRVAVAAGSGPAGVWVQQPDAARLRSVIVHTIYRTRAGVVLVTELLGPGSVDVNKTLLGGATPMEFLTIRGRPAIWFSGAPHEIAVQEASGEAVITPVRLAGNVLLWADDTRTIRIEGIDDQASAVSLLERLG